MRNCEFRKPGEDFCTDCPLRPVLSECKREGFIARPFAPSHLQRAGVFLLSALSLLMIPVVLRNLMRLQVEGDVPLALANAIMIGASALGVVVTLAGFYGIHASVFWGHKKPKIA